VPAHAYGRTGRSSNVDRPRDPCPQPDQDRGPHELKPRRHSPSPCSHGLRMLVATESQAEGEFFSAKWLVSNIESGGDLRAGRSRVDGREARRPPSASPRRMLCRPRPNLLPSTAPWRCWRPADALTNTPSSGQSPRIRDPTCWENLVAVLDERQPVAGTSVRRGTAVSDGPMVSPSGARVVEGSSRPLT
jgi:hypothetical protein